MRAKSYPCLCLCRGFLQMTMVLPCRLITRQRSHMGLTDALTFISACLSSVSVGDSAPGQVVGRELHLDLVARKDPDVVLPHLPGDRGEDRMASLELNPEHRARERLRDLAFYLDFLFLFRHAFLRTKRRRSKPRRGADYGSKPAFAGTFAAVSTRGPSSSIATVCSKWAAREPSWVEIDQSSEWR